MAAMDWASDAREALDELVEAEPILVRISAAKRLRDAAERSARGSGNDKVTLQHVWEARALIGGGSMTKTMGGSPS